MKQLCRTISFGSFILITCISMAGAQSLHPWRAHVFPLLAFQTTENGPVSYVYDELGRLVAVIGGAGDAAAYTYDAVGNILSIQRYAASQISVISFSPTKGVPGTSVTIYGTGFSTTASENSVSFNGTTASIVSATANQIVTSVPSGASSGPITVTSPAGSATSGASFTVQSSSGAPTIASFSPSIVMVGTAVTITGTNFDLAPQNDRLVVNTTAALPPTSPAPTSTSITMTTPALAGSGHIALSTPGGNVVSSGDLFIPPGNKPVAMVTYTGRTTVGGTTNISIPTVDSIGLLLFDGTGGRSVSVVTNASGDNVMQLYGTDNNPIGLIRSCTGNCFLDSLQLPTTGTYTLGVQGTAAFTIYDSTPLTGSITSGNPVTQNLSVPGQNGILTFNAVAGEQATVQLTGNTISSVAVSVINPDGSTLVSASTGSASSFGVPTATLTETGLHQILIDPQFTATGSITVSLTLQGGDRPVPARAAGSVLDAGNALSNGLVGLFVMNEGTGTADQNLVDGQTASFWGTSTPAWNTTDPSVVFSGSGSLNSYLNAGTDLNFDQLTPNQMTVVGKVFVTTVAAAGVAEKNDGDAIDSGFVFGWDSSGALRLSVERLAANMRVATASGAIVPDQWLQVAFTWDGTVGNASAAHLYLNGVEQIKTVSADGSGTIGYKNATNQPFRIGNASFDTITGSLNGRMAYLAVYRGRMLSASDLVQLDSQIPINTIDVTTSLTPNGSPTTVTTSAPGQNARATFNATAGQDIAIGISNNTMGQVTVSLLGPNNTTLSSTTSSAGGFNLQPMMVSCSGTYAVYVQTNGTNTGSMAISAAVTNLPARPAATSLDTANPLATSLAGLFVMNEGSGTTDNDLVDNQAASFSGSSTPTWNAMDPSIVFNGGSSLNSYLNAGTDLTFDQLPTSKITVVAKVYVSTLAAAGIAEKNDGNTIDSGFVFGWDNNGTLELTVEKSGADMRVAAGSGTIQAGQWVQVAFTWDGTVGNASAAHLFVNGIEQTKASSSDGAGTLGYANATGQPFRIGNASFDTVAGSLNGKMGYLAVYKGRILTATEMGQLDTQLPIH